jgi:hypothetical protein
MNLTGKKIIAEGDSWFAYPRVLMTGGGIIPHLETLLDLPILNLAKAGDESRFMLSLPQRRRLEKELKTADVLLFSGGGNDIAGDQFCVWLNDNVDNDPANAIDWSRFDAAMDLIMAMYDDLALIRDTVNPNCLIVTHGYDFPPAEIMGRGINVFGAVSRWLGLASFGPWLQPSLAYCGWVKPMDQALIAREALTELGRRLQAWDARNHLYVDTQGLLLPRDWGNEIHPNRTGFEKDARKFQEALVSHD